MSIPEKNIIGPRIKEARNAFTPKMTQTDLAARLQVRGIALDKSAISKIESQIRGVTDKELLAIADALDVSVEWLLER